MTPEQTGAELILKERKRQIEVEKWDADHDSDHWRGELVDAAICYALGKTQVAKRFHYSDDIESFAEIRISLWPWEKKWWKPSPKNRIKELIKAGALIAAEIDRLQKEKNHELG